MRKGLYLVAAFLMGGATLTLNSCIDTTEPTGIEAMRSAKAEYLKALAEFRSAKAALELIEVEKAKLELELKRLEHEADKYEAMAAAQEAMYAYYLSVKQAHDLEQRRTNEDAQSKYDIKKIGSLDDLGTHGSNFVEGLDDENMMGSSERWRSNLASKFMSLNKK